MLLSRVMRRRSHGAGWTRTRAVLSLGMVLGLGAVGTMASWTDSASATTGSFTVATSDVLEMKVDGQHPAYDFAALTASGLMPGDTTAAALQVQNTGDLDFRFTAEASATGDAGIAGFLAVTAYDGAVSGDTCTGTPIGTATGLSGSAQPLITTAQAVAFGAMQTVCLQVTLADAVTKAVSGQSARVVVEFGAIED
ncbi:SipW-dependent-type signal peptide-containing protein [Tomitella cavernea]|uniref:Ribosomally synthesized peptide with SipW-like signal peptide n=1 Tax=Tomitella cavernea TaxID=1387982 RepID=A0ABP9C792_9ACTN|nr:SipW-dependent-type signal peptide-containing protein [Tomitella cavernea]